MEFYLVGLTPDFMGNVTVLAWAGACRLSTTLLSTPKAAFETLCALTEQEWKLLSVLGTPFVFALAILLWLQQTPREKAMLQQVQTQRDQSTQLEDEKQTLEEEARMWDQKKRWVYEQALSIGPRNPIPRAKSVWKSEAHQATLTLTFKPKNKNCGLDGSLDIGGVQCKKMSGFYNHDSGRFVLTIDELSMPHVQTFAIGGFAVSHTFCYGHLKYESKALNLFFPQLHIPSLASTVDFTHT